MTEVTIKSSVGKFEALYNHSKQLSAPIAIVIGADGTEEERYRKAADKLFETFIKLDFSVLRFDFRKDKKNTKDYDIDTVNLLDLTAAVDWLHAKNNECKSFWLCGFEIGAYYGLQIVMRRPEIDNYMLLSPNMRKNDLGFVVPCSSSGVLVRASEDLKFLEEDCLNLQEKLTTKTESKIKYFTIYNAERNFDTELEQLSEETTKYIEEKMSSGANGFHGSFNTKRRRRRKKKASEVDEDKIVYINPIKELDLDNI